MMIRRLLKIKLLCGKINKDFKLNFMYSIALFKFRKQLKKIVFQTHKYIYIEKLNIQLEKYSSPQLE